jgi:hypothetical protein
LPAACENSAKKLRQTRASKRHRRQVGRVGFHQQPLGRHLPGGVANRLGTLERDDAGKRNVETELQGTAGGRPVLGEAVHDAADVGRPLFGQDTQRIVGG